MSSKLSQVLQHLKKIHNLRGISGLLEWDQQVMMPKGSAAIRGEQLALIQGIIHEYETDKNYGKLLEELRTQSFENPYDEKMISLAYEDFLKSTKIPKDLVEEYAKTTSEAFVSWCEAKEKDDFELFAPKLEKVIELKKKMVNLIDDKKSPLDVCIDEFDRGMTQKRFDELFSSVKERLIKFIKRIQEAKKKNPIDSSWLRNGKFNIEAQSALGLEIAKRLGYSTEHGRLDVSAHPFTINFDKTDVRITTKYKENDFVDGLLSTIHETGHAIYEQNLNEKYQTTPVGKALGMSLHESQSLLYERHIGLSKSFWKFVFPFVRKHFPHIPESYTYLDAYKAINNVEPGLIRTEADEVTYPLHVILRFELEQLIMEGKLEVKDIPKVWREKMKEYLGIEPPNNATGCLQDVHWSGGAIGYFPSYLCGQMLSSQIFAAAKKQIPNLEEKIERGEFLELKEWLNKNIHEKGSFYSIDELMKVVTGEPLNPNYLLDHLESKYAEIYNLDQ